MPEFLPAEALLAYLSEVPILETVSDEDRSVYTFTCGCVASRIVSEAGGHVRGAFRRGSTVLVGCSRPTPLDRERARFEVRSTRLQNTSWLTGQ